jgi:tetratricopeptide (TPR) repeat protein
MPLAGYRGLACAYLAAAIVMAAAPAAAQTRQEIDWCANQHREYSTDLQIKGCTAVIRSGRGTSEARASAFFFRGNAYADKKDYDRAIADYTDAIRLNSKESLSYFYRAKAYLQKNEYDRAIADLSRAIELDPKDPVCFLLRGIAYGLKGDFNRAIADYDRVIKLDPNNAKAYYFRGLAKQLNGDTAGGDADLAHAVQLDPSVAPASESPRDTNNPDFLKSIVGTWQYPDKGVWIVVRPDGSAAQCRIGPQSQVYFSKGSFHAPNVIDWQDIWGNDQVTRSGDGITLTGKNGPFSYVHATSQPSDRCPAM